MKIPIGYVVASFMSQEEVTAIEKQFTFLPDNEVANTVEVVLGN